MNKMESGNKNSGYIDALPNKKSSASNKTRSNSNSKKSKINSISTLAEGIQKKTIDSLDKLDINIDDISKKIDDKAKQLENYVNDFRDEESDGMSKKLSKEERKIAEEEKKNNEFWAIESMLAGVCVACLSYLFHSKLMILFGLLLFGAGVYIKIRPTLNATKKKTNERKYDGVINRRGNTSLYEIASYVGKSVDVACADLQSMIKDGYFKDEVKGYDAYIDRDYMMLVITKDDAPIKDPGEEFEKKHEAEKYKDDSSFVKDIREAIDVVEDDEMQNYLYDLEGSIRRIETQIKKRPELKHNTDIIKLNNYYLPEIVKLVKKYTEGQTPGMMATIKDALETCAAGLAGIEKEISDIDESNMEIDIKVLKDTFKRDGLLGSDFDIKI